MADETNPADERGGSDYRLDDVMLAMDVVDTLRHREDLAARELDEDRREAALIERLRQIYRGQGIEVPDRVLADGVAALKESRFVYTPPKPSFAVSLAHLWVSRVRIARAVLAVLVAAGLIFVVYDWFVNRPLREIADSLEATHATFVQASGPARERADRVVATEGAGDLSQRPVEQLLHTAADDDLPFEPVGGVGARRGVLDGGGGGAGLLEEPLGVGQPAAEVGDPGQ